MTGNLPTVSVCVTTYQHAEFVTACLQSVLSQKLDGTLELLVGDDGSLDGTRDIIDAFAKREPGRLLSFHHSRNLGPTGNLSFLVARARGQMIAHLDGDDFWLAGKLAAQLEVLNTDPGVVAVFCNARVVDVAGQPLGIFNRAVPPRVNIHELMRRGNFLNHSSLLYRSSARNVVLSIGKSFIDYQIYLRLLSYGELAYVDQPLVVHRWRTTGSMIKTLPTAVYEGHMDAFHEAIFAGARPCDVHGAIGHFWGKLLVQSLLAGRWASLCNWGRRIVYEPEFSYSIFNLAVESLFAIPRSMASWWRRRYGNRVYFP